MQITREAIEKRLADLRAQREQVQANLVQLQANMNAYDGAIQDCEHWLSQINAIEKDKGPESQV